MQVEIKKDTGCRLVINHVLLSMDEEEKKKKKKKRG
jgi:hypothetical protein